MKENLRYILSRTPKLVFCALLVAIFSLYLSKQIRHYNEEGADLMQQLFKMESLLSAKPLWDSRATWISQEIPRFDTHQVAADYLLHTSKISLGQRGLELKTHHFLKDDFATVIKREVLERFDRATVELTIAGNEKNIVEWVHDLQLPGRFTGIEQLVVRNDESGLVCEIRVTQWFLASNRSLDPGQHHEPEIHHPGPHLAESF